MIQLIMDLLQKRKPDAPKEWRSKIPEMARRLEDSLYRSAKSREFYNDNQTLEASIAGGGDFIPAAAQQSVCPQCLRIAVTATGSKVM